MHVDERLPQGNAGRLRVDRRGVVRFAARHCGSPRSMWWGFRILGAKGSQVPCVWERTRRVLGSGGLAAAVPVMREADEEVYHRVPQPSCRYDRAAHRFEFVVPCRSDETWVYYCYPYGPAELDAFVRERLPEGSTSIIGRSAGGRPCLLISLTGPPSATPRRQVWLRARSHAGEVSGSYVLEGALVEALRRPKVLQRADLYAVPFVDVDGVHLGYYGKDRRPRDFNRDACLRPVRPEVRALLAAVDRLSGGRVDYAIDLHAPAPGDRTFLVPPHAALLTPAGWRRHAAFARALAAHAPAACPAPFEAFVQNARGSMNWAGDLFEQVATAFFWSKCGGLALTLETTYHRSGAPGTATGRLVDPPAWRRLGAALIAAIADDLAGRVRRIGRAPAPPSQARLGPWLRLNDLADCRATVAGRRLTLAATGKAPRALVATPAVDLAAPRRVVRYRLGPADRAARVQATVREMRGAPPLPTGRGATAALRLRPLPRWTYLPLPAALRVPLGRLVLEITNWTGSLTLDLGARQA
jgi:hypothetical protein